MITRSQAFEKVNELIKNRNLVRHCLAVEAAMYAYADYFEVALSDKETWGLVGLIHDADWEAFPEKHPQVICEWLRGQGESDEVINAIEAHGFDFNIEAKTLMAKTLRAVDELTGLITSVTLVRPEKRIADVTVSSVLKKWKVSSFAQGVKREDIKRGAAEIEVPLEKHIEIVLTAMQGISDELGL